MIRTSQIYQLAEMYLRSEINVWENIQTVAEGWPNSAKARLNAESARRSKSCFEMLLSDLENGNIVDDLPLRGGKRA